MMRTKFDYKIMRKRNRDGILPLYDETKLSKSYIDIFDKLSTNFFNDTTISLVSYKRTILKLNYGHIVAVVQIDTFRNPIKIKFYVTMVNIVKRKVVYKSVQEINSENEYEIFGPLYRHIAGVFSAAYNLNNPKYSNCKLIIPQNNAFVQVLYSKNRIKSLKLMGTYEEKGTKESTIMKDADTILITSKKNGLLILKKGDIVKNVKEKISNFTDEHLVWVKENNGFLSVVYWDAKTYNKGKYSLKFKPTELTVEDLILAQKGDEDIG